MAVPYVGERMMVAGKEMVIWKVSPIYGEKTKGVLGYNVYCTTPKLWDLYGPEGQTSARLERGDRKGSK